MPTITFEEVYEDGGYVASVESYGAVFACHYVAGEVRTYGISTNLMRGWKLRSAADAAKRLVAARISELGPRFKAAHRALYELD